MYGVLIDRLEEQGLRDFVARWKGDLRMGGWVWYAEQRLLCLMRENSQDYKDKALRAEHV